MEFLIFSTLAAAFYFLPSIIGLRKRNAGAIFVLNLFLGWTVIGWVVSLVWALTNEGVVTPIVVQANIQPSPPVCSTCHAPVRASDVFCTRCGNKIGWPVSQRTLA
jgi:hypothetical protein